MLINKKKLYSEIIKNVYTENLLKLKEAQNQILEIMEPESDFEKELINSLYKTREIEDEYNLEFDHISLKLNLLNGWKNAFWDIENWNFFLEILREKPSEDISEHHNAVNNYFYDQVATAFFSSIYNPCEMGAFLYLSKNSKVKYEEIDSSTTRKVLNWKSQNFFDLDKQKLKQVESINEYCGIDLDQYYFSKNELEHIEIFYQIDGFASEAERTFYQNQYRDCLLYTSPSPRDKRQSRMPSSA